ncbi:MAG: carboxylating nicotinate-nucleotide diphosphorylase [Bryobacteraceae bacterium]|nr:carboxylating nicotinate-nucleotide diphosphorylase [Bryobacteraceae bacterium]MDW8378384.1 carboxylating nicotinate-nucleotide diphosphorylase [Bryobacterales bacterium]
MFDWTHPDVERAVRFALEEDIGTGDVTTQCCVPEQARARGGFWAREPMVVAGVELLEVIYRLAGGIDSLRLEVQSGDRVEAGTCLAWVEGAARRLLTCERVALNFLQRLSGVATLARRYADEVRHTRCRILDTRKTTPGLRLLEKMAVAAGGASNHRMGLYDAVLIKNNHIALAGGVCEALRRAFAGAGPLRVEIEVRTRAELDEALACGAKHLLLDNVTPSQAAEWIRHVGGRASCEISGGVTLENVRAYAEAGADFVSCGALTHSARAMDLNFHVEALA